MGKTETMVIYDYFKTLDRDGRHRFRVICMDKLEISYTTFYQKMRENRWKELEKDYMLRLIKELKNETVTL